MKIPRPRLPDPLLLVTGFGPFLLVEQNPSGEVARALALDPPAGVEVVACVLPVSFREAPRAFEQALAALMPRRPDLILGLGVQKESWFRIERRARCVLDSHKPDLDGCYASELGPIGARDLECGLDLSRLLDVLMEAGAVRAGLSSEAGGYVCERTFHAALAAGERLGVPAVFLHVPAVEHQSAAQQLPIVRALAVELARQVATPA